MLTITTYTTYDSIRAVLGLSVRELSDATLGEEIYAYTLEVDLLQLGADILTDYATAAGESTAASEAFVRTLRIFAAQSVGYKCAEALPQLSKKGITDGKAGIYRDDNSPYKVTMTNLKAAFESARLNLQEAYGDYSGAGFTAPTPVSLMGTSGLAIDPVTGE